MFPWWSRLRHGCSPAACHPGSLVAWREGGDKKGRGQMWTPLHSQTVAARAAQSVLGGEGRLEGLLLGHYVSAERKVI